ncbi:hypothetical protein R1flu_009798 [Riccia fluitans]|uniref:HORMA domain-containing protein n=1 Tax=Riccia fluitans TaxID=41844 RepID=A0ABD1Z3H2_9MARC
MERGQTSAIASPGEVTDLLCEFLEVAIHLLLSLRNIYPAEIFERRRHFNVPVQWIRHQDLRDYVHSALSSLHSWIQQGTVEKVAVVFMDKKRMAVERFIFKLNVNQNFASAMPVNDLEYALRTFLIKLSVSHSLFRPLPADCSFEIVAYSKLLPGDATDKGRLWIPADCSQWQQPPEITPVKSVRSELLDVQLYIEHPSAAEQSPSDQQIVQAVQDPDMCFLCTSPTHLCLTVRRTES